MKHNQTVTVESLSFTQTRTYLVSALFVAGNVVLPQLCHLLPMGGLRLLPIYFFTLIAAYRYGLAAGLTTAVLSPIVNNLAFGMPPTPMLPIILIKSTALALAASTVAKMTKSISIAALIVTVVAYQAIGSAAEGLITGSAAAALQDIRVGFPGLLLQVFGGYAALRMTAKQPAR